MMLQHYIRQKKLVVEQKMDFYTPLGIHVYFQEPIENKEVDAEKVIARLESTVPEHLLQEVEMVIFGRFAEFEERTLSAFYDGGTLYVSPSQDDEADLYDDLVHEVAHSLESPHGALIYQDGKIKEEFLNKRRHLYNILWQMGYKLPEKVFMNPEYDKEFDMFLLNDVGYDKLSIVTQGLFIHPYSATSLPEYFATGFTEYYLDSNHKHLQQVSPQLYKKILQLQDPKKLDNPL